MLAMLCLVYWHLAAWCRPFGLELSFRRFKSGPGANLVWQRKGTSDK